MAEVTCLKCHKHFRDPYGLKRHQSRATPCTLIVEAEAKAEGNGCKYCGRQFASKQSMQRHIKQSCKVANSPEGMEALFHHTIQKNEEHANAQAKAILEQKEEISKLRCMMEQLAAAQLRPVGANVPPQVTINATYNNNTTQNTIVIQPWQYDNERIIIPATLLRAAFTENPKLIEYCTFTTDQQTNDDAIPYVIEALMDLVKRAHKEPAARNVYLNPNRADQVMVFDEANWKLIPLMLAIRSILDSVATQISRIVLSAGAFTELPAEIHGPASMVSLVYKGIPDECVQRAKGMMVAHLANNAPRLK